MKKILLATLLTTLTFARGDINQAKSRALSKIDKKISLLNEAKSCISGASSREALKSCRKSSREKMKAFRQANKDARKQRRAASIQKLEERLKKMKASQNK